MFVNTVTTKKKAKHSRPSPQADRDDVERDVLELDVEMPDTVPPTGSNAESTSSLTTGVPAVPAVGVVPPPTAHAPAHPTVHLPTQASTPRLKESILPVFGDGQSFDAVTFIDRMEELFKEYCVTDTVYQAHAFLRQMRGSAQVWAQTLSSPERDNYEKMVNLFRARWLGNKYQSDMAVETATMRQKENEPLMMFVDRVRATALRGKVPLSSTMTAIYSNCRAEFQPKLRKVLDSWDAFQAKVRELDTFSVSRPANPTVAPRPTVAAIHVNPELSSSSSSSAHSAPVYQPPPVIAAVQPPAPHYAPHYAPHAQPIQWTPELQAQAERALCPVHRTFSHSAAECRVLHPELRNQPPPARSRNGHKRDRPDDDRREDRSRWRDDRRDKKVHNIYKDDKPGPDARS